MAEEQLLSINEARARILAALQPLELEEVAVEGAVGRALPSAVIAGRTLPPWDNSAMDGYAVRSQDTRSAPVTLEVVEQLFAGQTPTRALGPNQCARIMTGAPLPQGADAVVMQERTRGGGERVEILQPAPPGQFVRAAGEDTRAGEPLFEAGTVLGIPEMAMLLGQGITRLPMPRKVRAAVLSTGDELCPAESPVEGKLVDTNGPALRTLLRRAGAEVTSLGIARDEVKDVVPRLIGLERFDLILTSAGVSVGERDPVKPALEQLGVSLHLWRVAIKPGKPLAFGTLGKTAVFGLPGNPTSSLVGFELFVRPALRRLWGHREVVPRAVPGIAAEELKKPAGLTHFVRVRAEWRDGSLLARALATQTSGVLRSSAGATHLLVFPREQVRIAAGSPVELLPLDWGT